MAAIFYFLRRMRSPRGLVLFSLLLIAGLPAVSQEIVGTITGTVTDTSGTSLGAATVKVLDLDRGTVFTAMTNEQGSFNLLRVPVGRYQISATKLGFRSIRYPIFSVTFRQTANVDVRMKVAHEIVDHEYGIPPMLQTASSELSTTIDSYAIERLPL